MTRASAAIVLGLMCSMSASAARAQSSSTTTIHGRVLAAESGDPIRNARVAVTNADAAPVLTDGDGRFAIAMPAGVRDNLSAAKTGYVGIVAPAADGVELRLPQGGVITGHVLDDLGAPLPLMRVVAQRVVRNGGRVTFEPAASADADDRGEYRIFGLPGGEFVVATHGARESIAPPQPAPDRPPSHYYPGASTPEEAQVIRVVPGGEVPGINLAVALPQPGPQFPRSTAGAARAPLGTIRGRIVNADGLPSRLRRVALESADGGYGPYLTVTDHDGRYELRNLPPGGYRLSAGDLGAAPVTFGQRRPSDRGAVILIMQAGGVVEGIDLTVPRATVVAGRVVDEYGDPMENAGVRVYRIAPFKGRRSLVSPPGPSYTLTNDLGRYRLSGVPPGRYLISAVVGQPTPARGPVADWPGYARTYFPGTPLANEAQQIEIAADQDVLNADIALIRERGARITGTAYTAAGTPLQGQVSLAQSVRSGALSTPPLSVRTGADGRFAFEHLAPGEYVLQASAPRGSVWNEGEFASQFVTLNGDDAGVVMRLSAGSTVEGRLRFEDADPPEDPELQLSAVPVELDQASLTDDAPARADVHDDLTFQIAGLNGPRRLQLTQAPDGWALKQVLVNGGDATDLPLAFGTRDQSLRDVEVVLTKRLTTLSVTAQNVSEQSDFRIVAFAADAAKRYPGSRFVTVGVPDRDATAPLRGLPPGDYYVAAADRRVFDEAGESGGDLFESLVAGATKITLTEGEARSVSVSVIR
jgi:protocatechuate 3,4-dioxygenase beta subunit